METILEIEGSVRLETAEHVYAFMKELLKYELFVGAKDYNLGLREIKDGPTFRMARPLTDPSVSRKNLKEFTWAIGVDQHLDALYIELLTIGNVHRMMESAWQAYRGTAYYGASAIFIVHNHLNGDPTPNRDDILFTKEAIEGGLKLGRPLLDHIIMGDDCYHSFKDKMDQYNVEVRDDILGRIKLRDVITKKDNVITQKDNIITQKDNIISEKDEEIAVLKALLTKK